MFSCFLLFGCIFDFFDLNCYTISCYVSKIKKFVPSREVPPLGGLFSSFLMLFLIFDCFFFFFFNYTF